MDSKLWTKVEELFHAALECPPESRQAFLDQVCNGEADLKREVEFLLAQEERAGSFLEKAALGDSVIAPANEDALLGNHFGAYRIVSLLGVGGNGDEQALGSLMSLIYPELRRIARQHLGRRSEGGSLESAALANETYLKLARAGAIRCENRAHFLALASQMIRRILVDHARKRGFAKRGGDAVIVPLDDVLLTAESRGIEFLALNDALESLSKIDGRKARVVELRYFGGLSVEETAEVLRISPETAKRDWRMARAWLFGALAG